ncbi:MAG: hypothetical protein EOO61_07925 [Hymenobacter sp.]|nr:MAG: hypothetical protein EOO61_07925 [Hymenobacter sp.]
MNTTAIAALIIFWIIAFAFVVIPSSFYRKTWDHVTRGHYREDRDNLRIMIDHLRSFPEEWSISRDQAAFPKEGAKQIYLNFDKKKGWEYTLASFGSTPRALDGHYGSIMNNVLLEENNRREKASLVRTLHPNLEGPLLLK